MKLNTRRYFHGSFALRALLLMAAQACAAADSSDVVTVNENNLYAYREALDTRLTNALAPLGEVKQVAREEQTGWAWTQLQLFDETYPLTVDVVASTDSAPQKVVYFFPGGSTNFHAEYFVPHEDNVAHYFREHGYAVIGITAREENVPANVNDLSFTATWGIEKHRADVRRVIEAVQGALSLPYEVLGHSYGASLALDYGATYAKELERLVILDIYSFDPSRDAASVRNAQRSYSAYNDMLSLGMYTEATGEPLAELARWSDAERKEDSGVPRALFGVHRGNFTNEASYYFGLIETAQLPGASTLITGLESDWPMVKGLFAGTYTFAEDPRDDMFLVTHVSEKLLIEASSRASRGMIPAAFSRDYWAALAGNRAYNIDWKAIKCPLLWLNTELGYAEQFYGALAAREAGNEHVTTGVIAGYGHSDIFLSREARSEVWPKLMP